MAVSTVEIPSVDWRFYVGGTVVGGSDAGTLTLGQANPRTTPDALANWETGVYGMRSWSLSASGVYLQSSVPVSGVALAPTVAGTAMKGVREVTIEYTCDMANVVNSTTTYDRKVLPGARRVNVSIATDYFDPAGTGADTQDDLLDELEGTTTAGLTLVIPFGATFSQTLTSAFVTGSTIEKQNNEAVRQTYTFASRGAVTIPTTTNLESPVAALFTGLFASNASTAVTALIAHSVGGTQVDGSSEFEGDCYVESATIRVPFEGGPVTFDVTLQGTGDLTRAVYTAP